jgi:hypothetical protein
MRAPCDDCRMDPLALFFSASGRIAPRTFAVAVVIVYVAGFASQILLGGPVVARSGLWPFALTQGALTWMWFALHAKRRRDAGAGSGAAAGIAILYVLSVALLLLVLAFFLSVASQDAANGAGSSGIASFLILFYLLALFSGDMGSVSGFIVGLLLVACAPAIIAMAYSIYAGTQPSVTPMPATFSARPRASGDPESGLPLSRQ